MSDLYQSILYSPGTENPGGWQGRLLFYPAHFMKSIPTLKRDFDALEDLAEAEGAFEFWDETRRPIAIYATAGTVEMKAENQGELDAQSFHQSGEFFHPTNKQSVMGFARMINNVPGYLVLFSPEGDQFIIGQKGLPCYVKPSFNGGKAMADRRGTTFTFEADSFVPLIKIATPISEELIEEYFYDDTDNFGN